MVDVILRASKQRLVYFVDAAGTSELDRRLQVLPRACISQRSKDLARLMSTVGVLFGDRCYCKLNRRQKILCLFPVRSHSDCDNGSVMSEIEWCCAVFALRSHSDHVRVEMWLECSMLNVVDRWKGVTRKSR